MEMLIAGIILVHSWYPNECCHENDCKPIPCAELTYKDDDVLWDHHAYPRRFVQLSPDGACHICINKPPALDVPGIICVFVPKATS